MGILNVTPDSFSDGGDFISIDSALERAYLMVEEGAAIIDIGGESTRPGALPVSVQEELDRVLPIVEGLTAELSVPLSVDTSKPEVMRAAVRAGAGLINDVRALSAEGALQAVYELKVPVCLMHMQGEPRGMQHKPQYRDVVSEVKEFLADRVEACLKAGIARESLVLDPGFGFGKGLVHNLSLLRHIGVIAELGLPLLVGLSRKSMFGALLNLPVDRRLYASLSAAVIAVLRGASIIRVHDVRATVEAIAVAQAVEQAD
ncbi:MAG: dihydropteroate synthase [Pseudomonadota bacterium]